MRNRRRLFKIIEISKRRSDSYDHRNMSSRSYRHSSRATRRDKSYSTTRSMSYGRSSSPARRERLPSNRRESSKLRKGRSPNIHTPGSRRDRSRGRSRSVHSRRREEYSRRREESTYRDSWANKNNDIEALSKVVGALVEEVRALKASNSINFQPKKKLPSDRSMLHRHASVTPEPEGGYHRRARVMLEDMDKYQYKLFHDEVIQILNGLDTSLQLDHTKKWVEIIESVSKYTMKAIDKAMDGRFLYKNTELKWVLQQLHRHRRENWKTSQNPVKIKSEKKRKGTNSRRGDKKDRRQKGLSHMFYINDRSLEEIKPSSLSWDDFKKDCESFNKGGYHSDEISETDDDLAKEEITARIRPKNKKDTDKHVLHVYDKPWRSGRVRHLLREADKVGEKISHVKVSRRRWYEDKKWCDNSKPPDDAPEWTISHTYNAKDDFDQQNQQDIQDIEDTEDTDIIGE